MKNFILAALVALLLGGVSIAQTVEAHDVSHAVASTLDIGQAYHFTGSWTPSNNNITMLGVETVIEYRFYNEYDEEIRAPILCPVEAIFIEDDGVYEHETESFVPPLPPEPFDHATAIVTTTWRFLRNGKVHSVSTVRTYALY